MVNVVTASLSTDIDNTELVAHRVMLRPKRLRQLPIGTSVFVAGFHERLVELQVHVCQLQTPTHVHM